MGAASVAACCREASRAGSRPDFPSRIAICSQEAGETWLWLEFLRDDCGVRRAVIQALWQEADELIAIFVTMARNTTQKDAGYPGPGFEFPISGFALSIA